MHIHFFNKSLFWYASGRERHRCHHGVSKIQRFSHWCIYQKNRQRKHCLNVKELLCNWLNKWIQKEVKLKFLQTAEGLREVQQMDHCYSARQWNSAADTWACFCHFLSVTLYLRVKLYLRLFQTTLWLHVGDLSVWSCCDLVEIRCLGSRLPSGFCLLDFPDVEIRHIQYIMLVNSISGHISTPTDPWLSSVKCRGEALLYQDICSFSCRCHTSSCSWQLFQVCLATQLGRGALPRVQRWHQRIYSLLL